MLWIDKKVKQFCDLKVLILRSNLEALKNEVKQSLAFSWASVQANTSFSIKKLNNF
jgi:hypothetical protein